MKFVEVFMPNKILVLKNRKNNKNIENKRESHMKVSFSDPHIKM